jgi:ParB family transcriptional regulator, chromosome partitioning protein
VKGRDALREMLAEGKSLLSDTAAPIARPAGAVKAMNLGLQRLSDEASAAKSLRATLAGAEHVIEITPSEIEFSFVRDRLPVEADPSYESLKAQIAGQGQQVPILVRPHPEDSRRYQVAYGHRRLRAAAELGRPVKAIVRKLTDYELVIAQGQENSERRDLSFIERALFASHLEKRDFDRSIITAALGVDMPELSRLLGVVAAVDAGIIQAIGPAPKVGRPRWLMLAGKANSLEAAKIVKRVVVGNGFATMDSNARFAVVLSALLESEARPARGERSRAARRTKGIAWLERSGRNIQLVSKDKAFGTFLEGRLPSLLVEFAELTGKAKSPRSSMGE